MFEQTDVLGVELCGLTQGMLGRTWTFATLTVSGGAARSGEAVVGFPVPSQETRVVLNGRLAGNGAKFGEMAFHRSVRERGCLPFEMVAFCGEFLWSDA